jgi:hypothetical protein
MNNYLKWWQGSFFIAVGIFVGVMASGKVIYFSDKRADEAWIKFNELKRVTDRIIDFSKPVDDDRMLQIIATMATAMSTQDTIMAYIPTQEQASVMIPDDAEVYGMPEAKSLSDKNRELGGYDKENRGEK